MAVELTPKRLALYKEEFPRATRIALLLNANDQLGMQRYVDEFKPAAAVLGLTFEPIEVRSLGDFQKAFDRMVELRLEGVFLLADGLFYQGREQLAQLTLARRLPLVVHSRETLEAGALMSYGPDMRAIFRRARTYVDKILKGEKPSDLPVELPTKFELLASLKTARALGREFSPSVLAQMSDVID